MADEGPEGPQSDELVDLALTDYAAAQLLAGELKVVPEGFSALKEFADDFNLAAGDRARHGAQHVNYLYVIPIEHVAYPDTTGMSHDDALDAMYDAADAAELIGYTVRVAPTTPERLERATRRRDEGRRRRAQQSTLRPPPAPRRGPRARGAGRPGHRGGPRANAPPSDDDDGESEPPSVARRSRRAFRRSRGAS